MSNAPVCHVPPQESIAQPDPVALPSVPVATDLGSALAAINALRTIVNHLTGNTGPTFITNNFQTNNANSKNPQKILWVEDKPKRVTNKVRVYNPQDKTQYVDVEQINQVVMKNNVTGQSWKWNR